MTPATDTLPANSWILEKRKTRPDEGLHDTWPRRCRIRSLSKGQTRGGDCYTGEGVIVASCDLQHSAREKPTRSHFTDFRNSTTTHMDGTRRGLVQDGGCGAATDGVTSAWGVAAR